MLVIEAMSLNIPNPSLLGILLIISTHDGPQIVFKYPPDLSKPFSHEAGIEDQDDFLDTVDYLQSDNKSNDFDSIGLYENRSFLNSFEQGCEEDYEKNLISLDEWGVRTDYCKHSKMDLMLFLDMQEMIRKKMRNKKQKGQEEGAVLKKFLAMSSASTDLRTKAPENYSSLKKFDSHISDSQKSSNSRNLYYTSSQQQSKANIIYGMDADYLCEMLCPPKQMCNTRFEIMIDDIYFLGLPIHRYDNGTWKSKSHKRSRALNKSTHSKSDIVGEASVDQTHDKGKSSISRTTSKSDEDVVDSMNMFHLSFVMHPPVIENNYRIDEMFHYVVSRLSMILKHEQLKHDYVWNQVCLISKLKEEYRHSLASKSLTNYLIERSSLSKLISDCYFQISKSKIADLLINDKLRSFQIPIKTEFQSLPEPTVPYLPGSRLYSNVSLIYKAGLISLGETTPYGGSNIITLMMINGSSSLSATMINGNLDENDDSENEDYDSNAEDIIYYALLLLDDPKAIIRDIRADLLSILATFIQMIKPTESLSKLCSKINSFTNPEEDLLTVEQLKSFAFHLIYWRRAIVIPPVSARSVYIVSPMAPISLNMYYDITEFKKEFPNLPSLPHFLKLLSSPSKKPGPFASIIPSKDHRELYLNALGWLIRYGYVSQLHTFIWLKISRKVKMKVEEDIEMEALKDKRKRSSNGTEMAHDNVIPPGTDNSSKQKSEVSNINTEYKTTDSEQGRKDSKEIDDVLEDIMKLHTSDFGAEIMLEEDDDTIILNPGRATTLERKWIHKVISEECKLSPELTRTFYELLKYMNGKTSLEMLLIQESINRSDLRSLLIAIEKHIISVRHW